jgi:hypothetical protein
VFEGGTIRFTVPQGFEIDEGPGELLVWQPVVHPRPLRCLGADSCGGFVDVLSARVAASFSNRSRP